MHRPFAPSRAAALAAALAALTAAPAAAQTDYYNTDKGRPIRIEDAYPTERYSIDLHLAPVTLTRSRGGVYTWAFEPEIAYGVLPRTQLELGVPLAFRDAGGARRAGLAGLDLTVLHNFNVETRTLPALGVRAGVLLPVGSLAPDRAYPSVQGIATRTFRRARIHVNGAYTLGPAPDAGGGEAHVGRWLAGLAVDRAFPLRSLLVGADLYAERPLHADEAVAWNAGAGVRYQLTPVFAVDAGLGKRLTGEDRPWFVTAGLARVLGVRSLMPIR